MKKLLIITALLGLVSCTQRTYERTVNCLSNNTPNELKYMTPSIGIKTVTETYYFGKLVKSHESKPSCVVTCAPAGTDLNVKLELKEFNIEQVLKDNPYPTWLNSLNQNGLKDRKACIPNKKRCEDGSYVNFTGIDFTKAFYQTTLPNPNLVENADAVNLAAYQDCLAEEEGPINCLGTTVRNSATNTCVEEELACSGEELGENVASAVKTFDTSSNTYGDCFITSCNEGSTKMGAFCIENPPVSCTPPQVLNTETNLCVDAVIECPSEELPTFATAGTKTWSGTSYDVCMATTCSPGYMVLGGSCAPIIMPPPPMPVIGCTDPSAANYNPMATMNDMSCFCADENIVWSLPIGCYNP